MWVALFVLDPHQSLPILQARGADQRKIVESLTSHKHELSRSGFRLADFWHRYGERGAIYFVFFAICIGFVRFERRIFQKFVDPYRNFWLVHLLFLTYRLDGTAYDCKYVSQNFSLKQWKSKFWMTEKSKLKRPNFRKILRNLRARILLKNL